MIRDFVREVCYLKNSDLDISRLVSPYNPSHAHLREVVGNDFRYSHPVSQEVRDFYDLVFSELQKRRVNPQPIGCPVIGAALNKLGILGSAQIFDWGLPEVDIFPDGNEIMDFRRVVEFFPEIDFEFNFTYRRFSLPADVMNFIHSGIGVVFNTTRVDFDRFKAHAIGVPRADRYRVVPMADGQGYLNRLDRMIKSWGGSINSDVMVERGVDILRPTDKARVLLDSLRKVSIPK